MRKLVIFLGIIGIIAQPALATEDGEIHLGKRSGGWKFLFNPNYERYYPLTKEGLMNFLKRDDVIIYTEYFSFRKDNPYSKYEVLS